MEKEQRVPKGEKFWFIDETMNTNWTIDNRGFISTRLYINNNYFAIQEDAERIARKLRAVLSGADVLEFPSSDESIKESIKFNSGISSGDFSFRDGFNTAVFYLKSKIIK